MTRLTTLAAMAAIGMFLALGAAQASPKNKDHHSNSSRKDRHHGNDRNGKDKCKDSCGKDSCGYGSCGKHHGKGMCGDDSWNTIHPIPAPPKTPIRKWPTSPVIFHQPSKPVSPVIARLKNAGLLNKKLVGKPPAPTGKIPTLGGGVDAFGNAIGRDIGGAVSLGVSTAVNTFGNAVVSVGDGIVAVGSAISSWL